MKALGVAIASPLLALGILAGAFVTNSKSGEPDVDTSDHRASDEIVQRAYAELREAETAHERRFNEATMPEIHAAAFQERVSLAAELGEVEELERAGLQLFLLDRPLDRKRKTAVEANRCASCHHRLGPGGAGGLVDNFFGGRNPPSLAGASLLEIAAAEMTADLAADKAAGRPLESKGISFGTASDPKGVGKDLTIRPFGRGKWATLDETIGVMGKEALAVDLSGAEKKALRAWIGTLRPPGLLPPDAARLPDLYARFVKGRQRFADIGCASCHVPEVSLANGTVVRAYTDFRFHDVGTAIGKPGERFLTAPLWGVAGSAPWLHDGRALGSLDDAIYAHGGEAEDSRAAYAALDIEGRGELKVFLLSLAPEPKIQIAGQ